MQIPSLIVFIPWRGLYRGRNNVIGDWSIRILSRDIISMGLL